MIDEMMEFAYELPNKELVYTKVKSICAGSHLDMDYVFSIVRPLRCEICIRAVRIHKVREAMK